MSNAVAIGLNDARNKGIRVAVAAVAATVVLEMMMRVGAPNMLGIPPMSPANLITSIFGLPQGHVIGKVGHFGLALIGFPIGYMIIAYRHFPGHHIVKGALYGGLLWLPAMAVIVPLAGQPFFFGFGMQMVAALVAHVAYGVILAAIIGKRA